MRLKCICNGNNFFPFSILSTSNEKLLVSHLVLFWHAVHSNDQPTIIKAGCHRPAFFSFELDDWHRIGDFPTERPKKLKVLPLLLVLGASIEKLLIKEINHSSALE